MTRYSLDCTTALVIYKITHQDRAGETGAVVKKEGEIVTLDHDGQAIIAAESGDIILCPASALHAAAEVEADDPAKHDFIAAAELVRWIPANPLSFTLEWKPAGEIKKMLALDGGGA